MDKVTRAKIIAIVEEHVKERNKRYDIITAYS